MCEWHLRCTGNLTSKVSHARPLGSRIIRYVRDGRTDRRRTKRRTDKSNAYCPVPYGRGIITWLLSIQVALLSQRSRAMLRVLRIQITAASSSSSSSSSSFNISCQNATCTNKFCSLLFSSSSSSMLAAINKVSLTGGGLCGKLHGGRSQLLYTLHHSIIDPIGAVSGSRVLYFNFLLDS